MHDLTKEALAAGAFGFTTSRTNSHKTLRGKFVPGRYSGVSELFGIGSALSGFDYGAFGMNSDFDDEEGELAWITELARETGQVACKPVGVLLGVGATLTPFYTGEAFQELRHLPPKERIARMRDPRVRERILKSGVSHAAMDRLSPSRVRAITRWNRMYTFGPDTDYEPSDERCVETIAAKSNRTVEEVA